MSIFKLLDERIQNLLSRKGLDKPTESQTLAIPEVLNQKNILLIAPTGIGKTEAVVLPLLHNLLHNPQKQISILYITPLRALNRDLYSRLIFFTSSLGIRLAVRHGDTSKQERRRQVENPPDVLITTPETLQILLLGRRLRAQLKNVKAVIIDEVHELASSERGAQLAVALERLRELTGREFQRIGLSATVGSPQEVASLVAGVGREIKILKTNVTKRLEINVIVPSPSAQAKELAEKVELDSKLVALLHKSWTLINNHRSTLFFVNTRDAAEFLASRFRILNPSQPIGIHHGSLSKEVRVKMEDRFKAQELKALIATSSLELGIDIGSADFSLQYNSPRQVSRLIQRVGRSGHRAEELSRGVILATAPDELAESFVLARKALAEELEELKVREEPGTVLANQLIAFGMAGKCEIKSAYKVIKRAYPFRNLSFTKFISLLEQLKNQKMLFVAGNNFWKKRRGLEYFYENISMIPDERVYRVIDLTAREYLGTLDESFVVTYLQKNTTFVMRGRTWRVAQIEKEQIFVIPSQGMGEIPSWIGEEIPVPFKVANEVGKLRREVAEGKKHDKNLKLFVDYILEQKKEHKLVPNDKLITLEKGENIIIINACFGTRVNETLAQLLSSFLAARLGTTIGVQPSAYRIIFNLPVKVSREPELIKEYFLTTQPEALEPLIKISLRNSTKLKWQLLHTAKKFGLLRKAIDYNAISVHKLVAQLKDSPVSEEAIARVISRKLDLENTKYILSKVQEGRIKIAVTGLTKIGLEGRERLKELMLPERAEREILLALKKRLQEKRVTLVCLGCKRSRSWTAKSFTEARCHACNSILLGVTKPEDVDLLRKNKLSRKEIQNLRRSANLLLSYGRKALLTFAARGVGPRTASRILDRVYFTEEDFLRELLRAELTYARTHRFWD